MKKKTEVKEITDKHTVLVSRDTESGKLVVQTDMDVLPIHIVNELVNMTHETTLKEIPEVLTNHTVDLINNEVFAKYQMYKIISIIQAALIMIFIVLKIKGVI